METIILIPDSFKGTLSSRQVCEAMERAVLRRKPRARVVSIPVADGGEGTVEAFLTAMGGERVECTVCGPHFAPMTAFYGLLPDAYATQIGFGYKDLSGGERQRISIARAILRNPKILILDEATAAMDTETERKIQSALEKLVVGRTTIMIAHRLSTLRDADKLIVIENGKMPEFGTHLELIAKKGIYYKLYKLQYEHGTEPVEA